MATTILSLSLLLAVPGMARPQPIPQGQPTNMVPSATLAGFAKSTKKATGQVTTVQTDSGKTVTRVINQTVTTGKSRSSSNKSSTWPKGKLAGIIIGVVVAIIVLIIVAVIVYKWRKRKAQQADVMDREVEAPVKEAQGEEDVVEGRGLSVPNAPGQVAYTSEPANPASGNASVSADAAREGR